MNDEYSELLKAILGVPGAVIGIGNPRPIRKLLKEPGTSATGSITKVERAKRNRLKRLAAKARKRNRQ